MRLRTLITGILLLTLVHIPLPRQTFAFSDVYTNTAYRTAISTLEERGVIEGYSDGTFRPLSGINRAEFLKIVLEGRGDDQTFTGKNCFPDVREEWFAPYVCTAKEDGIIGGYPDGTFKPEQEINFVEAAKIVTLAFGQNIADEGGEWYEKYVRALEYSKAIAPSIDGLAHAMTRGEMVETMWRLADNKTDQPTKGYLNVKYPELAVNLAADTPSRAKSCSDIRAFMEEAQTNMMMETRTRAVTNDMMGAPMAEGAESAQKSADYSETNVQVAGVDEADIVKTDGTFLYIVRGRSISIVRATPVSALAIESTVTIDDENFTPEELYVDSGRLVVLGSTWNSAPYPRDGGGVMPMQKIMPYPYYQTNRTQMRLYDVSDAATPKLLRTVTFDGSKISSRRIGSTMYLVLNQNMFFGEPIKLGKTSTEKELLPAITDSATDNTDQPITRCANVLIFPHVPSPQYLIVAAIPTDDPKEKITNEIVIGNGQNVMMSAKNLYVANTNWQYAWRLNESTSSETTDIYRFAVTADGVSLKAQGQVHGRILNQFSMDEDGETFRIATTTGQMWDSQKPVTNNLFILSMNLEKVGEINDIAPGEQIYSTRFLGNRVYMVTFKNTDPFFVIDTSDQRNPVILGQLKLPGYSDYLHPYDDNHVIGFGKEAIEAKEGDFAWYQGLKIALFDVSDTANPRVLHQTGIGDRGSESPLLHNHKALLFEKDHNLLAFPVHVNQIPEEQKIGNTGSAYSVPVFQGAYVYRITLENGFELQGKITHYTDEDILKAGSYFYGKTIERVIRIANSILTIGDGGVQSHSLPGIEKEGGVLFPAEMPPGPIYWEE